MTKCTVLENQSLFDQEKDPIEFLYKISIKRGIFIRDACPPPNTYGGIILLKKNYCMYLEQWVDLMYAYEILTCNDGIGNGTLYAGYWNSGEVAPLNLSKEFISEWKNTLDELFPNKEQIKNE